MNAAREREATEPISVVTLIDTIKSAGAERLAVQIATKLDRSRFQSSLCVSRWGRRERSAGTDALLDQFFESGGKLIALDRRSRVDVWRWYPLLSAMTRREVDILHSHVFTSNVWGAVFGRALRVPVVIAHEHTWSYEGQPLRRFMDREVVARLSDAFVSCSREDRRRMIEVEGIDPTDIHLIPNGIEAPSRDERHDVRAELGIPDDAPVVVAVGRLVHSKGFDVLIRAVAELRDSFDDLRVLIAGEGDDRETLSALLTELDLAGTAQLLGVRSDVPDLLDAADVAVSCSREEGSPLAVLEQMQAGKAIVATRVGGVPDQIEDGVHGLLVESDDPAGLTHAIGGLLRDPARREELGRAAHDRWRHEFDLPVMVRRVEELYEDLWARRS